MRHYTLTVSILAAFCFSACVEAPQNDGGALQSPDLTATSTPPAPQVEPSQFSRKFDNETPPASSAFMAPIPLSERFQGLASQEISQAEIDELIALQTEQTAIGGAFTKAKRDWAKEDPARRGPEPTYTEIPQTARLKTLWKKARFAEIRKKYDVFNPKILPKADVEEIIALEQEKQRLSFDHQNKLQAWLKLDPATRDPWPQRHRAASFPGNTRWQELKLKVRGAHEVKRLTDRIEKLNKTHNISLIDNELTELVQLHTEHQKLKDDLDKAVMKTLVSEDGQLNIGMIKGGKLGDAEMKKLPKDLLERLSEVIERIEAIQAPFEAAEKAAGIH